MGGSGPLGLSLGAGSMLWGSIPGSQDLDPSPERSPRALQEASGHLFLQAAALMMQFESHLGAILTPKRSSRDSKNSKMTEDVLRILRNHTFLFGSPFQLHLEASWVPSGEPCGPKDG